MPSFTTVIEDASLLLVYSANWGAGSSAEDPKADQYTQGSFTLTQLNGASMSFSFYGSSVAVYGSRRSNHGSYSANVDDSAALPFSGQSSTDQFNQIMFTSNMSSGLPNLTITNGDNMLFDVDYVTFLSSVGNDDENLVVNTYRDTHPAFSYTPSSAWSTPSNVGTFLGGSGQQATAILFFSANKPLYRPQQVLYFAGNLGDGQHTLEIQPFGSTGEFAIDYAAVYTAPSVGGSFAETPTCPTVKDIRRNRLPPGAIAGLVSATTLAVFACLFSGFLLWSQRRTLSPSDKHKQSKLVVGMQDPEVARPFLKYPIFRPSAPRRTRGSVRSQASPQLPISPLTAPPEYS
ncbi:hypothetical protein CVT25_007905 [Psilocybe cyanescens]|uniref:Transmembrane protein n=1 Tax=Psilocybe cyanescens TaxID=93625 RepID=A0A409W298_PSICY|nr:hypothetical protein CVT25_007905 [Psilocybe cyanescens]